MENMKVHNMVTIYIGIFDHIYMFVCMSNSPIANINSHKVSLLGFFQSTVTCRFETNVINFRKIPICQNDCTIVEIPLPD